MSRPKKPAKTAKNRLPEFRNSVAAELPGQLSFDDISRARRAYRGALWIIGTLLVGVVAGRLVASMNSAVPAPNPITTTSLSVAPSPPTADLSSPQTVTSPAVLVTTRPTVTQVQGGAPYTTMPAADIQPAAGPDAINPWQSYPSPLQGTDDTSAVE